VGAGTTQHAFEFKPIPFPLLGITAKPVGGIPPSHPEGTLGREGSTLNSTRWGAVGFLRKTEKKGALAPGQLADLVFSLPIFPIHEEEESRHIESYVDRRGKSSCHENLKLARLHAVSPSRSPSKEFGGYAPKQPNKTGAASHPLLFRMLRHQLHGGSIAPQVDG